LAEEGRNWVKGEEEGIAGEGKKKGGLWRGKQSQVPKWRDGDF
jgi:hypothetical protein